MSTILTIPKSSLFSKMRKSRKTFLALVIVFVFVCYSNNALAQSTGAYTPLIGITSVPKPLSLPNGAGNVTYDYAVKNFTPEAPLTHVNVADNKCSPVVFTEGDDDGDVKLDETETWRYKCTTRVLETTESTATVTGTAFGLLATHEAFATVVVGSSVVPPLISVINVTKVANPLSLPIGGGNVTFTYKVNNPGEVPLSDVTITDDKCPNISDKVGDLNGNNLLDIEEVWVYTCSIHLEKTIINTVNVTSFGNGRKAIGQATIAVVVDIPSGAPAENIANFEDTGQSAVNPSTRNIVWMILGIGLLLLSVTYFFIRKRKLTSIQKNSINPLK